MPAYKPLADLTPEELAGRIEILASDLNVAILAGELMGLEISVDVVDRPDPVFPDRTKTEVKVSAVVP